MEKEPDYRAAAVAHELDVLYNAAVLSVAGVIDIDGAAYNAAMFAARRVAGAMLDEARDAGVTEAQYERLRHLAEAMAHD